MDTFVKKCHVESSKPSVVVKKKRKKGVLTNISVKEKKTNKQTNKQ